MFLLQKFAQGGIIPLKQTKKEVNAVIDPCSKAVLAFVNTALKTRRFVDLESILSAPTCDYYSRNEITNAIGLLTKRGLIKSTPLPGGGDPYADCVVSQITDLGKKYL